MTPYAYIDQDRGVFGADLDGTWLDSDDLRAYANELFNMAVEIDVLNATQDRMTNWSYERHHTPYLPTTHKTFHDSIKQHYTDYLLEELNHTYSYLFDTVLVFFSSAGDGDQV